MKWVALALFMVFLGLSYWFMSEPRKEPPHRYACLSNVKQLVLGTLIYQTDWDDRNPMRDSWMDAIEPYAKKEWILHCPILQMPKPNPTLYGYCFDARLAGAKPPSNPATHEMIFESLHQARNASGFLDSLPKPGRHNGKNVIGYADGHAKFVSR